MCTWFWPVHAHRSFRKRAHRQRAQLALQRKTKPARFIDGVHFCPAFALEPGRPVQERLFLETLRRLGHALTHLGHHYVKVLVHINSKLDERFATIKLAAGSLK
jgi:hypothetical protein